MIVSKKKMFQDVEIFAKKENFFEDMEKLILATAFLCGGARR
jgi:hypothetical protein